MLINVSFLSLFQKGWKSINYHLFINVANENTMYILCRLHGETLDRIFLSLKSQFVNFIQKEFAFVRTELQIDKIINECIKSENSLILYTIVETTC